MFRYVERHVPRHVKSSLGFLQSDLAGVLATWIMVLLYTMAVTDQLYGRTGARSYRTNNAFHNSSARVNA